MNFLQLRDFETYMNADLLNQVIGGDVAKLDNAEESAMGFIENNLSRRFDLQREYGKTGTGRNATLVRWMLCLATYNLYNLVPDTDIPERVDKNYDDVRKEIMNIAGGRGESDLTPIYREGVKKTKFRYGSEPKRSHFPY